MKGGEIEHGHAIGERRLIRLQLDAKHALLIRIMPGRVVVKTAGLGKALIVVILAIGGGPAGEGPRGLIHVLVDEAGGLAFECAGHLAPFFVQMIEVVLRAERVQLEELAGEVFVRGAGLAAAVVEVIKHRQALHGGLQQLAEIAERVLADDIAIIRGPDGADGVVGVDVDVEVVVPEIDEQLLHLPFGVAGADERGDLDLEGTALDLLIRIVVLALDAEKLLQRLFERGEAAFLLHLELLFFGLFAVRGRCGHHGGLFGLHHHRRCHHALVLVFDFELVGGDSLHRVVFRRRVRFELLLHPRTPADAFDAGDFLSRGAKGGAIEGDVGG